MYQCTQFGTLRDSRQCSQDWSRLGFVSALSRLRIGYASTMPHLRLDYALTSISCEHCRSSRNHPHCVPRHIIYYCKFCVHEETISIVQYIILKTQKIYILISITFVLTESCYPSRFLWIELRYRFNYKYNTRQKVLSTVHSHGHYKW